MHVRVSAEKYDYFLDDLQKYNLVLYSDIKDLNQKRTYKLLDKLINKYYLL